MTFLISSNLMKAVGMPQWF